MTDGEVAPAVRSLIQRLLDLTEEGRARWLETDVDEEYLHVGTESSITIRRTSATDSSKASFAQLVESFTMTAMDRHGEVVQQIVVDSHGDRANEVTFDMLEGLFAAAKRNVSLDSQPDLHVSGGRDPNERHDESVPQITHVPTYTDCRIAARNIRGSQFGRAATSAARLRDMSPFRVRAPLSILLYIAARDGTLVWRSSSSLALLQPPATLSRKKVGDGIRIAILRAIDRHWATVTFAAPQLILLVFAAIWVPLKGPWQVGIVALLAAMTYCIGFMIAIAIRWVTSAPARRMGSTSLSILARRRFAWTITLCHQENSEQADQLMRSVLQRFERLLNIEARAALSSIGVTARQVNIAESVTCIPAGITTSDMRVAVELWARRHRANELQAVSLRMSESVERGDAGSQATDRGGFLFWYIVALAIMLLGNSVIVSSFERENCNTNECTGRPVSYARALNWMAHRLVLSNGSDFTPDTWQSMLLGWLTSMAGLMVIPVAFVAVRSAIFAYSVQSATFRGEIDRILWQPRVLLLVSTAAERDAVFDSVRDATGSEPEVRHLSPHAAFDLGIIRNIHVVLAQTQLGETGLGSAAITAATLISRLSPHYVIITGVCLGLRPDVQAVGDIVVSDQVFAVDYKQTGESLADFKSKSLMRGAGLRASRILLGAFSAGEHNAQYAGGAAIHKGSTVSLNTQIGDPGQLRELDVVASDMEGAGVYAAATREDVGWIIVKGIADLNDKEPREQSVIAARNAADFIVSVLVSGFLDDAPTRSALFNDS